MKYYLLGIALTILSLFSYSAKGQVKSYFLQDSTLTITLDASKLVGQTDTIYPNEIPKKVKYLFNYSDYTDNHTNISFVHARGRRAIRSMTSGKDSLIDSYLAPIIWHRDRFIIENNQSMQDSTNLSFITIHILPKPILEKFRKEEQQRLQDSISRLMVLEHHQKRLEELRKPQENLTERDRKNIDKIYKKLKTPDGIKIKIDSNLFIDQTEIANIHYLEYLYFLLKDSLYEKYHDALPDTTVWAEEFAYEGNHSYRYFRHPAYRNYSTNGITYEQALEYCIWRGNMVSKICNEKLPKRYRDDYEIIIHYRLPTPEEWTYAAIKDDLNYQFGGYSTKRRYTEKEKRKIYRSAKDYVDSTYTLEQVHSDMDNYFKSDTSYKRMFNYRVTYKKPYFDGGFYPSGLEGYAGGGDWMTHWIFSHRPTKHFKLYNIFGNVAEMTSEKGIAKGGSFVHTLEECAADEVQYYENPEAWLGFRCVAEVFVRKKKE